MFIVLPIGRTKRVTLESILRFSSRHRNVTGKVAELDDVPNPVITALIKIQIKQILIKLSFAYLKTTIVKFKRIFASYYKI